MTAIDTIEDIISLRKRGVSLKRIAEKYGVTYQRIQQIIGPSKHLKPKKVTPRKLTRDEIFWSRVDIRGENDCWPWVGYGNGIVTHRYPNCRYTGKSEGTHRAAYLSKRGPIPDGMEVCHTCDNPICCNPNHLFLATHLENVRDRVSKGRNKNGPNAPHKFKWGISKNGKRIVTAA